MSTSLILESSRKRARAEKDAKQSISLLIVEGSIGVGKSTTIRNVMERFRSLGISVISVEEPVDSWTSPVPLTTGEPSASLLERVYTNECSKIGFQIMALTQRYFRLEHALGEARRRASLHKLNNEPLDVVVVSERSPLGDFLFAKLNLQSQSDLAMYFNVLCPIMEKVYEYIRCDVNIHICHLHLDLLTIADRIEQRGRPMEQQEANRIRNDPTSYVSRLSKMHDEMFNANGESDKRYLSMAMDGFVLPPHIKNDYIQTIFDNKVSNVSSAESVTVVTNAIMKIVWMAFDICTSTYFVE